MCKKHAQCWLIIDKPGIDDQKHNNMWFSSWQIIGEGLSPKWRWLLVHLQAFVEKNIVHWKAKNRAKKREKRKKEAKKVLR